MVKLFIVYLILTLSVNLCDSANILGIFHLPSYSHYYLTSTLMKELAKRGHNVTVINPFPQKTPIDNFRDVPLTYLSKWFENHKDQLFKTQLSNANFMVIETGFQNYSLHGTEMVLNETSVQALLKSNEKFDLVMLEEYGSYALKGFAYHFNAPCIIFVASKATRWVNPPVGNPMFPAYIPEANLAYTGNMSFFERLHNTFVYAFIKLVEHLYAIPRHNKLLQKYFPGAPHLTELHYNVSLAFVNTQLSTHQPVPFVPNMINIGGFHIQPPKELPKDLKQFLDDEKEGVVIFSMGSTVKSTYMSEETRIALFNVFSKLKHKVLVKWDDEPPSRPSNVKIEKWLPLNDVLAHPNIKLFLTHGGLLSIYEAIYHGVPVVGMPVASDHKLNMVNAVERGLGLSVLFYEMTESKLLSAVEEVLTDSKYKENAKRLSKVFHDQPMKPLDKAIFWIEYVIRHRGAPHLRVASLNLSWYQYLLLDVIAFVLVIILTLVLSTYVLIRKLVFRKKSYQNIKEKKNN